MAKLEAVRVSTRFDEAIAVEMKFSWCPQVQTMEREEGRQHHVCSEPRPSLRLRLAF